MLWSPDDRDAMLAWLEEQDLKCSGCGLPRDETMVHEDDAPQYVAEAVTCWACATRDRQQRDLAEVNKGKPIPGVYWAVGEQANGTG